MNLEENKISLTAIKLYLKSFINGEYASWEFKTWRGWMIYSLSLIFVLCVPGGIIIGISGLLSGDIELGLLIAVSLIPFIYITPLALVLTFMYNYRSPKILRKYILEGLERYRWDSPVQQVGQTAFECIKEGYLFRTEIRLWKDKGRKRKYIVMIIPYFIPKSVGEKEEYMNDVDGYLRGRCVFEIKQDMAFIMVPVKLFPRLDLDRSIEELLYAMKRFDLHTCTFYTPAAILDAVPETFEIMAMTVFDVEIDYKWIDWAKNMLNAGFVNENMRDFSNQHPGNNVQEKLREQVEVLICEFNLDIPKEYVLLNYICYLLQLFQSGKRTVLNVIQSLSNLYVASGISYLLDFRLLYIAKINLDKTGNQNLWTKETLTSENIDDYIVRYLELYLETHIPNFG